MTDVTQATDWTAWQQSWDAQQEGFMPDREARFAAMLDVVEVACGPAPRVLDLACGTGSITLRLLERLPNATSIALDLDPALLRIARGTFGGDERVTVVRANLGSAAWTDTVDGPFDAVLTATALHWLPESRLKGLYAEIAGVLRPGGVFCNADHMPDRDLPGLTSKLKDWEQQRTARVFADTEAYSWEGWWKHARSAPELADAVIERDSVYPGSHSAEFMPDSTTHLAFLREAGFAEVGLIWRGHLDAAFAAVR